jgi:soluble lytic murein transglycosylase-like protein
MDAVSALATLLLIVALLVTWVWVAVAAFPNIPLGPFNEWLEKDENELRYLRGAKWLSMAAICVGLLSMCTGAAAATAEPPRIPVRADGYAKLLEREAVGRFGLSAPVALLAAQLHQESHWRTDARSPYAQGLAQFTPATAAWIPGVCADLGPPNVWDARWSIRAQACYMRHLHRQLADAATPCDRWAMTLSAYNGGLGWLSRDRRLASDKGSDPARWFDHVEQYSKRAAWAIRENRDYPRRILLQLEPLYLSAGWPGSATCPTT